jgi:hypothetical protein
MLGVDIEKSSRRGDTAMLGNRRVLQSVLRDVVAEANIPWEDSHRDDLGDGMRLVLGRDVNKSRLLHPVAHELAARLRTHNRTAGPLGTIRVRMAVHAGEVHMDDAEVVGGSLKTLARLLDAPPLRNVLAAAPETATVALAVSEHIHEDVVRHGYPGIDPATYQRFRFTVKETTAAAWLHVPGHLPPFSVPGLDDRVHSPAPDGHTSGDGGVQSAIRAGNVNIARDHARVGEQIGRIDSRIDHVAGDVHIGRGVPAGDEILGQLAELRRALVRQRAAGKLDDNTYEAAADELRTAESWLSSPGTARRDRFVLALKRLKGLVEGIADLGAKVAALIAAGRTL